MQVIYFGAVFLACWLAANSSLAANLGPVGGRLHDVANRIDTLGRPFTRPLDQTLRQIKDSQDGLHRLAERIEVPLPPLPKVLPILDDQGNPVLVDVEVEQGWRAVEREWLVLLDDKDLPSLLDIGVDILERTRYEALGSTLVRFKVSPELDSRSALAARLPGAIAAQLDRNHIYGAQAGRSKNHNNAPPRQPACKTPVSVGMIDTAINLTHKAFSAAHITAQNFLGPTLTAPDTHGTAVASVLVGNGEGLKPLLPQARVFAASVFFARKDYPQGSTLVNLISALNWLTTQPIRVINMSLAGPDNHILGQVIEKIQAKGFVIVAAAGNEGPAASPMYPAAYPGVVAVTAVDQRGAIYRWANQGSYIAFAALGVGVPAARATGGVGKDSGTSMATPVVSALMACALVDDQQSPAQALAQLIKQSQDLGETGRDGVFGYGLL